MYLRAIVLTGLLILFGGCVPTNFSEIIKELAASPNANCLQVNAPGFGSISMAKGTPHVSVSLLNGSCTITGDGLTNVLVPSANVSITPITRERALTEPGTLDIKP